MMSVFYPRFLRREIYSRPQSRYRERPRESRSLLLEISPRSETDDIIFFGAARLLLGSVQPHRSQLAFAPRSPALSPQSRKRNAR